MADSEVPPSFPYNSGGTLKSTRLRGESPRESSLRVIALARASFKMDRTRPAECRNMEKRKERRFKQWNRASIKSADGPREFADPAGINAYTYDISLGGAKVYSDV